jgi:hypothetical protein
MALILCCLHLNLYGVSLLQSEKKVACLLRFVHLNSSLADAGLFENESLSSFRLSVCMHSLIYDAKYQSVTLSLRTDSMNCEMYRYINILVLKNHGWSIHRPCTWTCVSSAFGMQIPLQFSFVHAIFIARIRSMRSSLLTARASRTSVPYESLDLVSGWTTSFEMPLSAQANSRRAWCPWNSSSISFEHAVA